MSGTPIDRHPVDWNHIAIVVGSVLVAVTFFVALAIKDMHDQDATVRKQVEQLKDRIGVLEKAIGGGK